MESASDSLYQTRYWGRSIMGPFSEEKQYQRADSIRRLLENNPQMDELTKGMWENKLRSLAMTEERYNARVVCIFSKMKTTPNFYEEAKF